MMMKNYKQIQGAVEKLNLRERGIVLSAILLVVFSIWYMFWFAGLSTKKAVTHDQYSLLLIDERNLVQQIQVFTEVTTTDLFSDKKQQLFLLQKKQSELNGELAHLSQGLVSVQRLSQLLQDVLQKTQTLELIEMVTLPVELQTLSVADEDANDQEVAGVYKHGVAIVVRGNFFEVNKFLLELESLSWRFYWQSLEYEVTRYPEAEVKINVYTLSAEEGFLGV